MATTGDERSGSPWRIEMVREDQRTDDPAERCAQCPFKSVVATTCCGKRLCRWHVRRGIDDGDLDSCDACIEAEDIPLPDKEEEVRGYVPHHRTLYCRGHAGADTWTECSDPDCHAKYCARHADIVREGRCPWVAGPPLPWARPAPPPPSDSQLFQLRTLPPPDEFTGPQYSD